MNDYKTRKDPLKEVNSVEITVDAGLVGDHNVNKGGKRMVTLIQKEHLEFVQTVLGRPVSPLDVRRNIVVSGINLLALHDREFHIGDGVVLKGTGHCVPCSRMEQNLGVGGYNSMRGHGGITATVISGGTVSIGDSVRIHSDL